MATLLQLVERLARDPEAKAAYAAEPESYLRHHGYDGLDHHDVGEAVAQVAAAVPARVAAQLSPTDGLDGVVSVDPLAFEDPGPTSAATFADDDDPLRFFTEEASTADVDDGLDPGLDHGLDPDDAWLELDGPTTAEASTVDVEPEADVDGYLDADRGDVASAAIDGHVVTDGQVDLDAQMDIDGDVVGASETLAADAFEPPGGDVDDPFSDPFAETSLLMPVGDDADPHSAYGSEAEEVAFDPFDDGSARDLLDD